MRFTRNNIALYSDHDSKLDETSKPSQKGQSDQAGLRQGDAAKSYASRGGIMAADQVQTSWGQGSQAEHYSRLYRGFLYPGLALGHRA